MKFSLAIEPGLLAWNPALYSAPDIEDIIDLSIDVMGWVTDDRALKLYIPEKFSDLLHELDAFPFFARIRSTIEAHQLAHVYDPSTVNQAYLQILQRAADICELSQAKFLIPDNVRETPPLGGRYVHPRLLEEFKVFLSHLCIAQSRKNDPTHRLFLVARPDADHASINIEARLTDVEFENQAYAPVLSLREDIPMCFKHDHLHNGIDPVELWNSCQNCEDLKLSIELYANEILRLSGRSAEDKCAFTIGPDFLESLHRCGATAAGQFSKNTLDACARAVTRLGADAPVRMWKRGKTGDREDITRDDNASAFRLHVSGSKEGLRLMYWLLPSGRLEFANVGNKFEEKISFTKGRG